MLSLGLDPSMRGFGWCVHDSAATGAGRVVDKGRFCSPSTDVFVARYMGLRECIMDLVDDYPEVDIVGVESPPFGELWSEGLYGLFLYVNEALYTKRKDVVYFDPVTVKFLVKEDKALRPGKMFKSDMMDAARTHTGISKWNADEADAYHIARFAARFAQVLNGSLVETQLTPSEKHSFLRTKTFSKGKHAGETVKDGLVYREEDRFFRFSQLPRSQ